MTPHELAVIRRKLSEYGYRWDVQDDVQMLVEGLDEARDIAAFWRRKYQDLTEYTTIPFGDDIATAHPFPWENR